MCFWGNFEWSQSINVNYPGGDGGSEVLCVERGKRMVFWTLDVTGYRGIGRRSVWRTRPCLNEPRIFKTDPVTRSNSKEINVLDQSFNMTTPKIWSSASEIGILLNCSLGVPTKKPSSISTSSSFDGATYALPDSSTRWPIGRTIFVPDVTILDALPEKARGGLNLTSS